MKKSEKIQKGLGDLNQKLLQGFVDSPPITPEEAVELVRIAESVANYQKVSKALCNKENATLGEVLQAVSQVKKPVVDGIDDGKIQLDVYLRSIKSKLKYAEAERDVRSKLAIEQDQRIAEPLQCRESYIFDLETELEAVKRERDAAVKDIEYVISKPENPLHDCMVCKYKDRPICESCEWEWRGVCPENMKEEKKND